MTTVVSIMMSDIVPLRERGIWQGVINIIYASGAGCGAPLGRVRLLFYAIEMLILCRGNTC